MVAALVPAPVASTWANMFQPGNFEKHTTYCITSHQKLIRCSLHNTQCLGNLLFTYAQLPTFLNRLAVHQVSEARTSPIPQDRNAIKSINLFLVTSCSFFLRELWKCFPFNVFTTVSYYLYQEISCCVFASMPLSSMIIIQLFVFSRRTRGIST